MAHVHMTKVVSRNFVIDMVARFQNLLGLNLTAYQKMVDSAISQIWAELGSVRLEWYRYEIFQLTNGAVSVTLYGVEK
jgi:hypothetical protein